MTRTPSITLLAKVLTTYARALDERRWELLDQVFAPDVFADYGGEVMLEGRDAVRQMIRTVLTPCGPTQHLLGNHEVGLEDGQPTLRCEVRAFHADADPDRGLSYELFGVYTARFQPSPTGWEIVRFEETPLLQLGSTAVLGHWPS